MEDKRRKVMVIMLHVILAAYTFIVATSMLRVIPVIICALCWIFLIRKDRKGWGGKT